MYLNRWKFLAQPNGQLHGDGSARNERYKKLLPLIRRFTFISECAEPSTPNALEGNSPPRLQVYFFLICENFLCVREEIFIEF